MSPSAFILYVARWTTGTDAVAVMSQLLHHPCAVNLAVGGVMKDLESPAGEGTPASGAP
jgi:hypothetical protein